MKIIEKIKKDNTSGANELEKFAKEAILNFISNPHSHKTLLEFLKELESARPEMAPIRNTVNRVYKIVNSSKDIKFVNMEIKKSLKTPAIDIDMLVKNLSKVMKGKKTVLTYSYSSTVLEVLIRLRKGLTVFVPESRPIYEGRKMAIKLRDAGLKVKFITDAEASGFIKDIDIVLVGADSFSKKCVINKIGTFAIALLAREFNVPPYVVCGKNKFSNKTLTETRRNPKEVWDVKGIEVINFYFEQIPIKYFTKIITD